jgi:chromosome segregation ATPase
VATLEDLEARVAALEASQADYRAVLSAVNALGANQGEMAMTLREVKGDVVEFKGDVAELKTRLGDTNSRVRSLEDGVAEIKDLLVRALDRRKNNSD